MTPYSLQSILDTDAAHPLRVALLARVERREAVTLDGSSVERAGLACLQVLASARATAAAEGLGFALVTPSLVLSEMVSLAGIGALLDPVERRGHP